MTELLNQLNYKFFNITTLNNLIKTPAFLTYMLSMKLYCSLFHVA